jgi:Polyketide cyclase / dehydrase and lipid transport
MKPTPMQSSERVIPDTCTVFCLIWCLCTTSAALAQDDPFKLQVEVKQQGETFNTQASFRLPLTPCQAWNYIVDYDAAVHIPGVVSSKTTRLGPTKVRVERSLRETFLFFPIRMHTVIEFNETAGRGTDFVQVEGEARTHRGSWRLEPAPEGTVFRYQAISEPDSSIPMPVIRYFLDKRLRSSFAAMAQFGAQRVGTDCPS